MRVFTLILASILLITPCAFSAEKELKGSMQGAFQVFSKLSPYLVDSNSFQDPNNHKIILGYLKSLSSSFHTAESVSLRIQNKAWVLSNIICDE